ncbi:hypothetical protein LCGC14_1384070 [marine sediment metagenome]|uniref:Uncharacterized protein n=1 Tax=marine sediment metagenome TaxID=412755 RepID=A0A0F9N3F2_9ZZZZ
MEAKDTVMSPDQLIEVWHFAIESPDKSMSEPLKQANRRKAVAEAQAEISFKAGIGEVVEWLKDSRANGDFMLDFESDWWLNRLKEWGIDGKL